MKIAFWAYIYMCVGLGVTIVVDKRNGGTFGSKDYIIGVASWPALVSGQLFINLTQQSSRTVKRGFNIGDV